VALKECHTLIRECEMKKRFEFNFDVAFTNGNYFCFFESHASLCKKKLNLKTTTICCCCCFANKTKTKTLDFLKLYGLCCCAKAWALTIPNYQTTEFFWKAKFFRLVSVTNLIHK
jgi:hypothetical protein